MNEDIEMNIEVKEKKLKLVENQYIDVRQVEITLKRFKFSILDGGPEEEIGYGAILTLDIGKNTKKTIPVHLHTQICGGDVNEVAYDALKFVSCMTENIIDTINIINDENIIIGVLAVEDVLEAVFEKENDE